MSIDWAKLEAVFAGVKIQYGLRQQGHMPTVERMRSEGKSWDEIGDAIGWLGYAVEEQYEMERIRRWGLGQPASSLEVLENGQWTKVADVVTNENDAEFLRDAANAAERNKGTVLCPRCHVDLRKHIATHGAPGGIICPENTTFDVNVVAEQLFAVLGDVRLDKDIALRYIVDALNASANSRPIPVGVSVLIMDSEERLLLGERINILGAGLLSTPGGTLWPAESIFQCAVRETREETGLKLEYRDLEFFGFKEHYRFGKRYIMFYVRAWAYSGELQNREPGKCKGWAWIDPAGVHAENCTEPQSILDKLAGVR